MLGTSRGARAGQRDERHCGEARVCVHVFVCVVAVCVLKYPVHVDTSVGSSRKGKASAELAHRPPACLVLLTKPAGRWTETCAS